MAGAPRQAVTITAGRDAGGDTCIQVADTGPGIPEAMLSEVCLGCSSFASLREQGLASRVKGILGRREAQALAEKGVVATAVPVRCPRIFFSSTKRLPLRASAAGLVRWKGAAAAGRGEGAPAEEVSADA